MHMNYILSKSNKHRKATSDCIANSQMAQSPSILTTKVVHNLMQSKYTHPSMERSEYQNNNAQVNKKLIFNSNNTNTKKKPANIVTEYKKLKMPQMQPQSKSKPIKGNKIHRSNSFDKYFIHNENKVNDKQIYRQLILAPSPPPMHRQKIGLKQQINYSSQVNQIKINNNGNSNSNTIGFVTGSQQSQKMMSFNSPFLKKHIEMKIKKTERVRRGDMIMQEENKNKKNNSISMEEYFQKTVSHFGKIHSISLKNTNYYNGLLKNDNDKERDKEHSQQITKRKQDIKPSNTSTGTNTLAKRFFISKQLGQLMTMPSIQATGKDKELDNTNTNRILMPLSSRIIEENIKNDTIDQNDSNDEILKEGLSDMEIGMELEDNFNTKELDEDVDKERLLPFQAKSTIEIKEESKKEIKANMVPQLIYHNPNINHINRMNNTSNAMKIGLANISTKYQDIIQNNINYSKCNNGDNNNNKTTSSMSTSYTNKRNVDCDNNKTPQINKYNQYYPQSLIKQNEKEHYNNKNDNSNNNDHTRTDNLLEESILTHDMPDLTNKRVIYSSKRTIQLPNKLLKQELLNKEIHKPIQIPIPITIPLPISVLTPIPIPIKDIDIDTECLFEGEEKNEREEKKDIPVFPIKLFKSYYNYINASNPTPKHSILECLFKAKPLYTLLHPFLEYKSIINLSLTNHFFRSKLKKLQYDIITNTILNNLPIRPQIKQSVMSYSKLINDSFISRTYYNLAYHKSKNDEDILKDLTRTFPDDETFKFRKENYTKLYHLLTAYANYNHSIGYAQGLNFLAAHCLFLYDKPEDVFLFIDGLIVKFQLEQLYGVKNNLKEHMDEIGKLLRTCAPYVMAYLEKNCLGHEFFTANWLLTLFSNSMRRHYLFYVWDFMIVYGKKFFNYFIVAVMNRYSTRIVTYDQSLLSQLMKGLLKSEGFERDFEAIVRRTFELMRINCI